MSISLRDVHPSDLPYFFDYQKDELAVQMTGFPPRERDSFDAHWEKILANDTIVIKTVLYEERVAGSVLCFENEGEKEVGYWLGREFWGKGIATEALRQFLGQVVNRPLIAHIARHNQASQLVLEKNGFKVIGETMWSPPTGGEDVPEFKLKLE